VTIYGIVLFGLSALITVLWQLSRP